MHEPQLLDVYVAAEAVNSLTNKLDVTMTTTAVTRIC